MMKKNMEFAAQMVKDKQVCPHCGANLGLPRNPVPTVDIVIVNSVGKFVLIERKNPPSGWALPGGFVDYGETVEAAAVREAREETCLDVTLHALLGVYSDPSRDPRLHTMSTVFLATSKNFERLKGADDAKTARLYSFDMLPEHIAFDHRQIIFDAKQRLEQGVPGILLP